MWDLDDLLQNSGNAQNDQAPVSDSDSDAMDMDTKPPKSRKGKLDLIGESWIYLLSSEVWTWIANIWAIIGQLW